MKISRVATLALAFGLLEVVASTVVVTATTATLATLANGVIAVKGVALGAAIVGAAIGKLRSRRQVLQSQCINISDPNLLFSLAVNADSLGCSQRFVCEIVARDIGSLSEDELVIHSVFVGDDGAVSQETGNALLIEAAGTGLGNDPVVCAEKYNKCPFDSKTLLKEVQKATKKQ